MNRNKLLLVFIIGLITMFSFNINVFAAEELTCLYEKNNSPYKVALVQDKAGKLTAFFNKDDVDFDSSSKWKKAEEISIESGSLCFDEKYGFCGELDKDSSGFFNTCPKYSRQAKTLHVYSVYFSNDENCGGSKSYPNKLIKTSYSSTVLNTDIENITSHLGSSEVTTGVDSSGKSCNEIIESGSAWLTNSTAKLSCLYGKKIDEGCHLIEIDVDTHSIDLVSNYASLKKLDKSKVVVRGLDKFNGSVYDVASLFYGKCPGFVGVREDVKSGVGRVNISDKVDGGTGFEKYLPLDQKGYNLISGKEVGRDDLTTMIKIEPVAEEITSCSQIIDENLANLINNAINIIKIFVPIILLVLGSLDLAKAVFAQDESGVKKAQSTFIKRLIIAVIIFLIPSLLHVVLSIANSSWEWIDPTLCGII